MTPETKERLSNLQGAEHASRIEKECPAQTIAPTSNEKYEWCRLANYADHSGLTDISDRYNAAASVGLRDGVMPLARFDLLQAGYRAWLVDGFTDRTLELCRRRFPS